MHPDGPLSGQTTEACWNSIAHAKPLGVGLNCALGADAMRPYLQKLFRKMQIVSSIAISTPVYQIHLPRPDMMKNRKIQPARFLPFCGRRLLNMAGGCCGTTPEHIHAISEKLLQSEPREVSITIQH